MYSTTNPTDAVVANRISRVYAAMAISVLISLVTAYCVGTNTLLMSYISSHVWLLWSVILAPFVILFACAAVVDTKRWEVAASCMLIFSVSIGLTVSSIFVKYSLDTVFVALSCTIAMFSVAAIYGFTTKRVLDSFGDFLIAALIALIVVSIINVFVGSSWLTYGISCVAVLVYLGLTVVDSQQLKSAVQSSNYTPGIELMHVINLHLDFIGMFVNLLTVLNDD